MDRSLYNHRTSCERQTNKKSRKRNKQEKSLLTKTGDA